MGLAMEVVAGSLSAAAATTRQSFTVNNSGSFTVRATESSTNAHLRSVWGNISDAGVIDIRSPRLHDALQAIGLRSKATDLHPLTPPWFDQVLKPVDNLDLGVTFDAAPTAATEEAMAMLIQYDNLGGADYKGRSWSEVQPVIKSIYGVPVEPETSATVGDWGTGSAINSLEDQFKSDELYAILGYLCSDQCTAIGITGSDTANYKIGGPGSTDPLITRGYFVDLANESGLPLIPVIQANNKASTLVDACNLVASTTIHVSLILANLAS